MKNIVYKLLAFLIFSFLWVPVLYAVTPEPVIEDYTNYPIFQISAVDPNIFVMLDNSGSMFFNAYGTYAGDGGHVVEPFNGPPFCGIKTLRVVQSDDNVETYLEPNVDTYISTTDDELDLGTFNGDADDKSIVAIRFQNVDVPKDRTITSAYIQFTAHDSQVASYNTAINVGIRGIADDSPGDFEGATQNGINNPGSVTAASVQWDIPTWSAAFQSDNNTKTPDLKNIIQEIVNRPGWQGGNAMVFGIVWLNGNGFREACSYAESPTKAAVLHIEFDYEEEDCTRYYGYFTPGDWNEGTGQFEDVMYNYSSSRFVRNVAGHWSGNFLNWLGMRRIDVARKVLMGGLATPRTTTGTQTLYGEAPKKGERVFKRWFEGSGVSQFNGKYEYVINNGDIYVYDSGGTEQAGSPFNINVDKEVTLEPEEFYEVSPGQPTTVGVFQRVGDKARWGNSWFEYGTGAFDSGATIANPIGTNVVTLQNDLQNTSPGTWTPLAEAYYVTMQYFGQKAVEAGLDYPNNPGTEAFDPYDRGGTMIECAKSFVILFTDGASTMDARVPGFLKDYADAYDTFVDPDDGVACGEDNGTGCEYPSSGTDYLKDIALYARKNDLRTDLDGDQGIILYPIYVFGADEDARNLLMEAGKNGGFEDRNGNILPDLQEEWDKDGNGVPDTYFEATDGYAIERELLNIINDILKRAASGTAVSVLATKGEGEGTLVQAFFKPVVPSGLEEIKWTGYLQSLWVDQYGNTREDTSHNYALDLDQDDIIMFYLDQATGETRVKVFGVSPGSEYPDTDNATPDATKSLEEIDAIWEAGDLLASRVAGDRKIFTYTGDTAGELEAGKFIEFTTPNAADMGRFFGVEDGATWGYLGATYDNRVNNIICFVRGVDDDSADYQGDPEIRPRTIDGRLWKLGDIVYSTPVSISKPVENYGLLYDDMTYKTFFQRYKGRETVVYVGGNDGMLHAFTSGVFITGEGKFEKISLVPGYDLPDSLGIGDVEIGNELWAYIPQNLLPHLKWLPYEEYTHVSYVDLKPKVVDARIFTGDADTSDNATHPGGWGTILIGGLNKGGKDIPTDNGTFSPCFFALDITNPRSPQLLWEKTFADLGLATNTPCILSVGNQWDGTQWSAGEWYLAISSGPTDYDGNSNQNGHVYIVDLLTGGEVHYKDFETTDVNACMNSPVAFDKGMNYNVDGIYVSANFGSWESRLWKITVPQAGAPAEFNPLSTDYDENPANWTRTKLFYSNMPITAPVTLSIDKRDNAWIFGGTGRYMEESDKTTTDPNFLFGIKDPFFNAYRDDQACYHKYGTECEINFDDKIGDHLFPAHDYAGKVKADGTVEGLAGGFGELLDEARVNTLDGWYRNICPHSVDNAGTCLGSGASERVLNKPAILGGIAMFPTFAPNSDVCGFGGNGRLFAVFYETGTAYKNRVMGEVGQTTIVDVIGLGEGVSSSFGVHVGKEEGGTIYGQMSTGVIQQIEIIPAFSPKSIPIYWREE